MCAWCVCSGIDRESRFARRGYIEAYSHSSVFLCELQKIPGWGKFGLGIVNAWAPQAIHPVKHNRSLYVCYVGPLQQGVDDVKQHKWFRGLDWDVVLQRKLIVSKQGMRERVRVSSVRLEENGGKREG